MFVFEFYFIAKLCDWLDAEYVCSLVDTRFNSSNTHN